jgi:hypothetical protein
MTPSHIVPSPRHPGAAALIAAGVLAVIAAGCGGSPAPSTGTTGAQAGRPGEAAYKFSACMRSHGLTKFPDPVVKTSSDGGVSVGIRVTPGETSSPAFKYAQSACRHLLPDGGPSSESRHSGPSRQAFLAFARCLRTHGFPRFPDPDAQGQLTQQTISAAGVNIHAPGFFSAATSCTSVTHGQITRAMLAHAINGPH